jgi:hypothetical protein
VPHGGLILQTFEIYPLYYGDWTPAVSGQNAPAGEQPMLKQYGVNQVAPPAAHAFARSLLAITDQLILLTRTGATFSLRARCLPGMPVLL